MSQIYTEMVGNVTFCLKTRAQSPKAGLGQETINPAQREWYGKREKPVG